MTNSKIFKISLICIPIFIYSAFFLPQIFNILHEDDYWFVSDFAIMRENLDFIEKLKFLFIVRNSHVCVSAYLIAFIQFIAFNEINAKFLIWGGYFLLLTICYLFYLPFKKNSILFLLPILFIFLNPINFLISNFPLFIYQGYVMFISIILTIYLVCFHEKKYILIAIFALISQYTFGNGIVIWPIIFLILILKRDWPFLICWSLFSIIVLYIYFLNYHNTGIKTNPLDSLTNLPRLLIFYLTFPGNGFDFFPLLLFSKTANFDFLDKLFFCIRMIFICLPISFAIYLLYNVLVKNKKIKSNFNNEPILLFVLGCFLFILITDLEVGLFRSMVGYGAGVANRYKYMGQFFIATVYLLYVYSKDFSRLSLNVSIIVSAFYCFLCYVVYAPIFRDNNLMFKASAINIINNTNTSIFEGYSPSLEPVINNELIPKIKKNHLFDFYDKKLLVEANKFNIVFKQNTNSEIKYKIIENEIFANIKSTFFDENYLAFLNEEKKIVLLNFSTVKPFSNQDNYSYSHFVPYYNYINKKELYVVKINGNNKFLFRLIPE